jgi:hypothetical protein
MFASVVAIDTYQSSLSLILQSGEFMSIDPSIKKNVINLINKERDITIHEYSCKTNITNQHAHKELKELSEEVKEQITLSAKKKQSVLCVVIRHN